MPRLTDNEAINRRLKEMPPEDKAVIDEAMTKFINEKYWVNRGQIAKKLGHRVDSDIISELQQRYYVWMYTRLDPDIVRDTKCITARLGKIFTFLVNHPSIYKMKEQMLKGIMSDLGDDEENPVTIFDVVADEPEETFTNGHLNRDEDPQERIEMFKKARQETIEWLMDNPHSKTAAALENTLRRLVKHDNKPGPHYHYEKAREELIDYITAPNISFLRNILGKHVNQYMIYAFREEFAKLYDINGGKPLYQSQLPTTGWQ